MSISSDDLRSEPAPPKRKRKLLIFVLLFFAIPLLAFGSHEFSVRYFQDKTCVVCHEMKEPIRKWKESGTALNHKNCAGCHFDATVAGWIEMNRSAFRLLIEHYKRDPNEPIKPRPEPLFLEDGKEPGYWSRVPNYRCYQCKDAKNHKPGDQTAIHSKLIKGISGQPCKDCHNHEMRRDQKFYEKVTAAQVQN